MTDKVLKDQEQKDAEAEVTEDKDETSPFVIAAETTRMPMVFTNAGEADNPIIFANDSFLKLTGYSRDEVLAQSFNFLLADETEPSDLKEIAAAFAGKDDDAEIRYRKKDGSVSLVDTTRHHLARKHAAMLIDELNHRVKNTLATVQSIVNQSLRNSDDPQVVREAVETRIAALSRSHDLLGREKWEGAGLRDLVGEALAPFGAGDGKADRFNIEGENVRLSPRAALALGIAFNELATNAVKYGALSNETGAISIEWDIVENAKGKWLCLHWREKGGPPVTPPTSKGFGSRVIEQGLAHELDGDVSLEYAFDGLICTIDVPSPKAVIDG